jgi:raffinose/stachyose/melibiose transport system permease protein
VANQILVANHPAATPKTGNESLASKKTITDWLALLALIVALLIMLTPFILIVMNSVKTETEYANYGPFTLPQGINLDAITNYWTRVDFTNKLINSAIISLSVAVGGVTLSLLNGYALGIGRIKGKAFVLIFFMLAITLPNEALAYPLYYFAKLFKLYDSQLSVILIFTVIQSAFGTYLISSILSAFPKELIESAVIDGCNKIQLLFRIIVPTILPSLYVLFTFFFIWTWNEFFLPLIFLVSNGNQTVPIAIAINQAQWQMNITVESASALLGMLPCVVFFIIFQRTLVRGVTLGSVK